ncbi:VTT domain-containing protein [Geoalkalibacter halelectricus]|uniref:VTT domain-containing protein n=1 Tax=Geoalkalibacter halelectricus TaxID=2847045 RepID=A0ABY5ZN50_9BACT|nr:VTT domain-containing protein [Geoalkalibacter halelectricus]MDO3379879.1 VTT domain-containing protein [Geoalkalibacter halelectricus]UWZ80592.1 VTT domain-containing protein [Geoalkalibacter halelectricus]
MTDTKDKPRDTGDSSSLFRPGHNCSGLARARRVTFLIDGADYFAAFRKAAAQAKSSIYIVGWDIHSSIPLVPEEDPEDGFPRDLGDFLNALVKRNKDLEVHVLAWDFAMIYALDREFLPLYRPAWSSHRRVHFKLDANHPTGGSHHQKIVVIDDALAFVGGLDLTTKRWDTSEHRPDDPRRVTPQGEPYCPFHDLEMMVDGEAAAALGELVRERWRKSGAKVPKPPRRVNSTSPWPSDIEHQAQEVDIAIARTEPGDNQNAPVQEIKHLYLDAIAAAERFIYIENQYLTATEIVEALADRLRRPKGPEIVILSRAGGGGWMEQMTMGVLRARLLKHLRAADEHQRLGVFYPHHKGLNSKEKIDLHSKLLIVDDRVVRIGSANLANRSMGYDTECDLAFEAQNDAQHNAIRTLRQRLLSEHLGTSIEELDAEETKQSSLLATIARFGTGERTLERLSDEIDEDVDDLVPEADLIDPEEPIDPDRFAAQMMPPDHRRSGASRLALVATFLIAVAALVMLWRWSPLGGWFHLEKLAEAAEAIRASGMAPLVVLGAYLGAAVGLIPVILLVVLTIAIFGPLLGFAYAWSGLLLGAMLGLWVGRHLSRDLVRRVAGKRLNNVSRRLAQGGIRAILAVRLIPVAAFPVVNLVAGASRVRTRHFFLGTLMGTLPGLVALTLIGDRIRAVVYDADPWNVFLLGAAVLLVLGGTLGILRILKRLDLLEKKGGVPN